MSENKKEVNNEAVKQLSTYKASRLTELNSKITREKTRAAVLMASIRAKREALIAKAAEEEAERLAAQEAAAVDSAEQKASDADANAKSAESLQIPDAFAKDGSVENVSVKESAPVSKQSADSTPPQEERKAEKEETAVETETPVSNQASELEVEPIAKAAELKPVSEAPKAVDAPKGAKDKDKKTSEAEKGKKKKETEVSAADNNTVTEDGIIVKTSSDGKQKTEIMPNGEVRRIYIPPTPKPKVQTRVFGQGGYNSRDSRGARNAGGAPYQGGGYQGRNNLQGGSNTSSAPYRSQRPAGGLSGANFTPPPLSGAAASKNKSRGGKPSQNTARFDDKTLNKRALIKKGYIVEDKIDIDGDGEVRIRSGRNNKNRGGAGGGPIVIENAIITTDPVSIKVLSEKIGKTGAEIIKTLFFLGIIKTINESIDFATAELVSSEFNISLEYKPDVTFEDTLAARHVFDDEDEMDKLLPRPPVVTIMGHVDHGKTSLLDYIRKTNVTGGEAGGITQHIGAYTVTLNGSPITFLDTPGHEAFTSMRARGAQVTDIAVLVVAADDGIMPQTIEAINHAKSAKVPIIVAVNKMDKAGANPDRVMQQLTDQSIVPEEWGGDTPVVKVSAKTGLGISDLLENILTLAEIKELKANPDRKARGTIIEARLDKGHGRTATILVQNGTLHVGDNVVAGICTGKIRAMLDDKGRKVKKAGPSVPVSVTGWDELPEAGDLIDVVADEKFARELAEERKIKRDSAGVETGAVSLNDLFDKISKGELKSVKLIVKADVQGSLEAVKQSLSKLGTEEVTIDIIHGGVGPINEGDVALADTAKAVIIGFNVRPDTNAKTLASQKNIDIRFYNIIYEAIDDIEKAVKGLLEPTFKEVILGTAEVRELFKISGVGVIAGSHVIDGKIVKGAKARLIRNGKVEYSGEIASLRHNKDDVKEMAKNFDCGIMLVNYQDVKQGDVIEAYQMEKVSEN
jgi:translation initiation factor IF-2